jgi:hypothetical protein
LNPCRKKTSRCGKGAAMTLILLDTHAWSWSIHAVERLSPRAVAAFASAETI